MTRPFLAIDIDVLLSSGALIDEAPGAPGQEPSFTYTIGGCPSAPPFDAPTGNFSDSFVHVADAVNGDSFKMRHVWLRPGIRRFLLAVTPHFTTVLLVRRRCGGRQRACYCCNDTRSASAEGGNRNAVGLPGGGIAAAVVTGTWPEWAADIGGCGAALLGAALPHIDPDGQFFLGQRVALVQDRPRPRTAQPKVATTAAAAWVGSPGDAAAAAAAAPAAEAPDPAAPAFPARARGLSSLPVALGLADSPSSLLVVTTADRSLFGGGGLAEQVIECQPYRMEYGKYDDVLDCVATVVTGLLAEASVPLGLRRRGLLHSRLQPSPVMQALQAQQALRQALWGQAPPHGQLQLEQREQQEREQAWTGAQATAKQSGLPLQQPLAAFTARVRAASATDAAAAGSRWPRCRRSGCGGRCELEPACGKGTGGVGGGFMSRSGRSVPVLMLPAATAAASIAAPTSPLPPIPEIPFSEVGADWPNDDEAEDAAAAAEAPPAAVAMAALPPPLTPPPGASPGPSFASTCSGAVGQDSSRTPSSQCRSLSWPPAQGSSSESGADSSCPSSSSAGSIRCSCSSNGAGSTATDAVITAPSPPLPSGRRTAWDATPLAPAGGHGRAVGVGLTPAAAVHQSLTVPLGAAAGLGGGGFFSRWRRSSVVGGDNDLGWRPGSFPAAGKPPVTRQMSDSTTLPAVGGGGGAVAAAAPLPLPPSSALSAAASAVAAATSRFVARILPRRHRRRCRPSDIDKDGVGAFPLWDETEAEAEPAAALMEARRSAPSAMLASAAKEDLLLAASVRQQARSASLTSLTAARLVVISGRQAAPAAVATSPSAAATRLTTSPVVTPSPPRPPSPPLTPRSLHWAVRGEGLPDGFAQARSPSAAAASGAADGAYGLINMRPSSIGRSSVPSARQLSFQPPQLELDRAAQQVLLGSPPLGREVEVEAGPPVLVVVSEEKKEEEDEEEEEEAKDVSWLLSPRLARSSAPGEVLGVGEPGGGGLCAAAAKAGTAKVAAVTRPVVGVPLMGQPVVGGVGGGGTGTAAAVALRAAAVAH